MAELPQQSHEEHHVHQAWSTLVENKLFTRERSGVFTDHFGHKAVATLTPPDKNADKPFYHLEVKIAGMKEDYVELDVWMACDSDQRLTDILRGGDTMDKDPLTLQRSELLMLANALESIENSPLTG